MIKEALEYIYQNLLSSCWIDCFGILVVPTRVNDKLYPISDSIYCDGCNRDQHMLLVPDSDRRTIAYFEQTGDISFNGNRFLSELTVPVRLVVWYDVRQLGYNESIKDAILMDITKRLKSIVTIPSHSFLVSVSYNITGLSISDPFQQFGYDQQEAFYFPYEWLNISGTLRISFIPECVPNFECLENIC